MLSNTIEKKKLDINSKIIDIFPKRNSPQSKVKAEFVANRNVITKSSKMELESPALSYHENKPEKI